MGGDWKIADSFLASLAAKEVFVSQLGILFSEGNNTDNESLGTKLKQEYSLPAAIAFILFMLFSSPCMATFAAVKAETSSWKWPILQFIGMNLIAYFVAVSVFKTLSFFL
jgi:ferrous iron transport protein B